jgi:hypothetical protein
LAVILKRLGKNKKMNKEAHSENSENIISEIIETGSEIGGSIGGALIGGLFAGPAGILIGGVSGPIITKLFTKAGSEIKKSLFGQREKAKIGFTYAVGYYKMKLKLENGEVIRNDDFFNRIDNNRSTAEEILEGVLRSSEKEYEEKKLKFYSNLLANISFTTEVNKDKAHFYLKTAQNLSYTQLCILQLTAISKEKSLNWHYPFNEFEELLEFGAYEPLIQDLIDRKLIKKLNVGTGGIIKIELSKIGNQMSSLMELNEISSKDLKELSDDFTNITTIMEEFQRKGYTVNPGL